MSQPTVKLKKVAANVRDCQDIVMHEPFLAAAILRGPILFPITVWSRLVTMLSFLVVVTYVLALSLLLPRTSRML